MLEIVQGDRRGLLLAPWFWRMLGRVPRRCHALPSERFTKFSVLASALVNVFALAELRLSSHAGIVLLAVFGSVPLVMQLLHACIAARRHAGRVALSVHVPLRVQEAPLHVRVARSMFWLSIMTGSTLIPVPSLPLREAAMFVQVTVLVLLFVPWFTARYFDRHPVLVAGRAG